MPEKKVSPDNLEDRMAYQRTFDRETTESQERIEKTSLPQEIRLAARDEEFFNLVDPAPGLGGSWELQRFWASLGSRKRYLERTHFSEDARKAQGFDAEPWRATPIVSEEQQTHILKTLFPRNPTQNDLDVAATTLTELLKQAEERVPFLCAELGRSQEEVNVIRKLFLNWWGWRNIASGQEAGEVYTGSKIPNLPRPRDFSYIFSLPPNFVSVEEATVARTGLPYPGYPRQEQVQAYLEDEVKSRVPNISAEAVEKYKENEPFGERVERVSRLMYLVALSDNPEKIMKWKLNTERAALNKKFIEKGVNPIYLVLREKGVQYEDAEQEAMITHTIDSLDGNEEDEIRNAWWRLFGFKNAEEGKDLIGDPEMLIPIEARRGETTAESSGILGEGFDRIAAVDKIKEKLSELKKNWRDLSPLNNLADVDKKVREGKIKDITNELRQLCTKREDVDPDNPGKFRELVTIFGSLSLERELGLRGTALEQSCVWARPQTVIDKEKIMDKIFLEYAGGDRLAYEEALAIVGMFGFPAKLGYYARDYDPEQPDFLKKWKVDVEAWPYTSEFQNILAFPWHQLYKGEAGGPSGSCGKFGPLMTDYLSAYSTKETDQFGNELFIIMDGEGNLRQGRPDEGSVLADTTRTLLEHWESGESLKDPDLWDDLIEDPIRRFLLRSFFAEGRTVFGPGGNDLIASWKKQDWRVDDLDSDKFWDDYKLARRVALREELWNEDIWRDVVAPVDREYERLAAETATLLKNAASNDERLRLMQGKVKTRLYIGKDGQPKEIKRSRLYAVWKLARRKAVFDYSDKTFGAGLLSTRSFEILKELRKRQPGAGTAKVLFGGRLEDPAIQLERIQARAKSRDINLGWNLGVFF